MDPTPRQVTTQQPAGTPPATHTPKWHQDAACAEVGGDWWFPDPHERISAPVLRICGSCPVRRACLLFALSVDVLHGVWAGLVPAELWALRQRVLDGESASAVLADGLATGEQRSTNRDGVPYRAAPWNPALGDLDHQIELVAQWTLPLESHHVAGTGTDGVRPASTSAA